MEFLRPDCTLEEELEYMYGDLLKDEEFRKYAETIEKRNRREDTIDKWVYGTIIAIGGSILTIQFGVIIMDTIMVLFPR